MESCTDDCAQTRGMAHDFMEQEVSAHGTEPETSNMINTEKANYSKS
jgi:hypothetical protein